MGMRVLKRVRFVASLSLVMVASSFNLIAQTTPRGIIPLFDGKDLSMFSSWLVDTKKKDPRKVFSVQGGFLRISGDGLGYLATKAKYANYRLLLEYRWGQLNTKWNDRVGKARDSGVFLHAFGPDGNSIDGKGAYMAGIECNILQGATGDILLIRGKLPNGFALTPRFRSTVSIIEDAEGWPYWLPAGKDHQFKEWGRLNRKGKSINWKDVVDFRSGEEIEKPPSQWNRLECVCRADTIQIQLNDQLVNEVHDVFPQEGKILFQSEGSEIFFRKIELHPLP